MRNVLRRMVRAAVITAGLTIATLPAIQVYAASATTAHLVMNAKPVSPAHVMLPGLKAVPAQQASSFHLCLTNAPPDKPMCQKSNGTGNQVTISSNPADWANYRIVGNMSCGADYCYQFENGNGNCLRAGNNHVVKIENGGCAASDTADWWTRPGNNRFKSWGYGDTMLTHGDVSGYNVWHATVQSGDWAAWSGGPF